MRFFESERTTCSHAVVFSSATRAVVDGAARARAISGNYGAAGGITATKLGKRLPAPRKTARTTKCARAITVAQRNFGPACSAAFEQAPRCGADASHELRTPPRFCARGRANRGGDLPGGFGAVTGKKFVRRSRRSSGCKNIYDKHAFARELAPNKSPCGRAARSISAALVAEDGETRVPRGRARLKISADVAPGVRVAGDEGVLLRRRLMIQPRRPTPSATNRGRWRSAARTPRKFHRGAHAGKTPARHPRGKTRRTESFKFLKARRRP